MNARVGVVAVRVEHARQSVRDPPLTRRLQGGVGQGQKQRHAGRRISLTLVPLHEQIWFCPELGKRLDRLGLHTRVRREGEQWPDGVGYSEPQERDRRGRAVAGERVGFSLRRVKSAAFGEVRTRTKGPFLQQRDCGLAVRNHTGQEDGELLGIGVHDQVDELLGIGAGVIGQDTGRESTGATVTQLGADVRQRTDERPADRTTAIRPTPSQGAGLQRATTGRLPARCGARRGHLGRELRARTRPGSGAPCSSAAATQVQSESPSRAP